MKYILQHIPNLQSKYFKTYIHISFIKITQIIKMYIKVGILCYQKCLPLLKITVKENK